MTEVDSILGCELPPKVLSLILIDIVGEVIAVAAAVVDNDEVEKELRKLYV